MRTCFSISPFLCCCCVLFFAIFLGIGSTYIPPKFLLTSNKASTSHLQDSKTYPRQALAAHSLEVFISGLASQIRGSLSRHIACRGGTIHWSVAVLVFLFWGCCLWAVEACATCWHKLKPSKGLIFGFDLVGYLQQIPDFRACFWDSWVAAVLATEGVDFFWRDCQIQLLGSYPRQPLAALSLEGVHFRACFADSWVAQFAHSVSRRYYLERSYLWLWPGGLFIANSMNIPKKEVLSARLANHVNKKLNPDDPDEFHFSEFYFNEMVDIFNLPGIDQWPKTLENSSNKFLFSLVSFSSPNRKGCSKMTPSLRHQSAHKLSLEMLHHCFPEKKRPSINHNGDGQLSFPFYFYVSEKKSETS